MRRRVTIDGLIFDGVARYGATGCYLIGPDGLTGWDDGPESRRTEVPRPVAYGSFDAPEFLSSRVYVITGTLLASTPQELRVMKDRLKGVLNGARRGKLTVEDDLGTRWAWVRRAGTPRVAEKGMTATAAEFSVTFWAPDPWQYGQYREFTNSPAQVLQRGNEHAVPIVDVEGNMPTGYTISSQGKQYIVSQPLLTGQTHRIDMRTGWLYRNGSLQSSAVEKVETFTIPPNKLTPVGLTPASGLGMLWVKLHDTFV
jgi:phage-related protein